MRKKKYKALRSLAYLYVLMDKMFDGIGVEDKVPVREMFFEVSDALCGVGARVALGREIELYCKAFEELDNQEGSSDIREILLRYGFKVEKMRAGRRLSGRKRLWTDAKIDVVKRQVLAGMSFKDIGDRFDVSEYVIRYVVKTYLPELLQVR